MLSNDTRKDLDIVIVDGDREHLAAISNHFEDHGVEVATYQPLARAEGEIKSSPPDLIVVDRNVGPFNGLDLCRDIRQTPWTDHIPIVLTGSGLCRTDILRATSLRVNSIMAKPYTADKLAERVLGLVSIPDTNSNDQGEEKP